MNAMNAKKTPKLAIAMNYIRDDLISGAIDYKPQKKASKHIYHSWSKLAAVAACLCIVLIGAITIEHYVSTSRGNMGIESINISDVKETGSVFTENEVENFLAESGSHVISRISEKLNIPAENITISNRGYYHVTVTENENILNLDYLTLPVIANGEIITSVTLYRDAGIIKHEYHYGGTWGSEITKLLKQCPDEQFVMIYIGDFVEAAISSENTIHFLTGEAADIFEADVDYYNAFKFEENTMDSSLLE